MKTLSVHSFALAAASLLFSSMCLAQTQPAYVYETVRYMPGQEIATFNTEEEAEAWIRQEPATPIGNQFLQKKPKSRPTGSNLDKTVTDYEVPMRAVKPKLGRWYVIGDGSIGKARTCNGARISYFPNDTLYTDCESEAAAEARLLAAYPGYTVQWVGSYGGEPPVSWSPYSSSAPSNRFITVSPNSSANGGSRDVRVFNSNGTEILYKHSVDSLDL
jgi:hypothetical protein